MINNAINLNRLCALVESNTIQDAPHYISLCEGHKVITIGIGPDHTAQIIIHNDALEVLYALTSLQEETKFTCTGDD